MSSLQLPTLTVLQLELHTPDVLLMRFNRPNSMNAMAPESYREWREVMQFVHTTPSLRALVITGNGRAYSAGQDLNSTGTFETREEELESIQTRNDLTRDLTRLIITCPIPIIAAVNGPAVGYACTTLALCDLVISVEKAIFRTPFAELAFCAEGCSSVTFPRILGPMVANDMILFGRTLSATEMHQRGFVARIVKPEALVETALGVATEMAGHSQRAIGVSRSLIRNKLAVEELVKANDAEMDELYKCMISDDAKEAVMKVFMRLQARAKKPRL
ncbi:hypothetical protein FBU59_006753 [Linderina macrospora]|uniref:Uncharacterized protein n=1 Tax=Linderina macrospora TaxID=4868 RepID=A0ACC1IZ07_9FUNG|nr:hypothetical protein FBU59_006753 [Linderina macrospora]